MRRKRWFPIIPPGFDEYTFLWQSHSSTLGCRTNFGEASTSAHRRLARVQTLLAVVVEFEETFEGRKPTPLCIEGLDFAILCDTSIPGCHQQRIRHLL